MIYPNILYQTLLKIFPFFLEILILPVALSMVCVCEWVFGCVLWGKEGGCQH